jgi:hypothetical protein
MKTILICALLLLPFAGVAQIPGIRDLETCLSADSNSSNSLLGRYGFLFQGAQHSEANSTFLWAHPRPGSDKADIQVTKIVDKGWFSDTDIYLQVAGDSLLQAFEGSLGQTGYRLAASSVDSSGSRTSEYSSGKYRVRIIQSKAVSKQSVWHYVILNRADNEAAASPEGRKP